MELSPTPKDTFPDTCVICLSPVSERAIAAPCNHYPFDFLCLVSWLQRSSTCPLCKAQVAAVQYDWASPTDFKTYTVLPASQPSSNHIAPSTLLPGQRFSIHAPYGLPRRPQRRDTRPSVRPLPDPLILRRRHVYHHKLYSFHIGSNPFSGYRDLNPALIASSPDLQSKARTFIRRELRVFTFLHTDPAGGTPSTGGATTSSNAEFLLSYIIAILKKVEMKGSNGHAEDLLQEYLGRENARLFLHELNSWMRSPYTKLKEWDENVQYLEELPEAFDARGLPIVGTSKSEMRELAAHERGGEMSTASEEHG